MPKNTLRFISAENVKAALSIEEAIKQMKDAFTHLYLGNPTVPQRVSIGMPENNGAALLMPVYSPKMNTFGVKIASVFHENPAKHLPTVQAIVFLLDAENGKPLSIMDGKYLTALRTGAVSGLATDFLAKEDAKTVAIFGTGAQGRTQLEAICKVRDIKRCFLFGKNKEHAKEFKREMSTKLNIEFIISESMRDLRDAEIICTATNSHSPVFDGAHVGKGTHINAIGAYTPKMSEIPAEIVVQSKIVVDQREACLAEAGDIIKPIASALISEDDIYAELGEIVCGAKEARTDETDITLFKSVGNAIQDLFCASQAFKVASRKNLGEEVSL